jgi:hypothetical protein
MFLEKEFLNIPRPGITHKIIEIEFIFSSTAFLLSKL